MRRIYLKIFSAVLLAATALPALARDSKNDWSFSFETAFTSQYLWRGFLLNDTPALQPNITAGYKGFSVSSWSNFAYRGPNGQNWTEHDLTLDYSHSLGKLGLSAGYILYSFPDLNPGQGHRSHEVYAGVSYDTLFHPSFTFYRDVDQGDGNYFYLSGGHSWELARGVVFNGGLGLGLNNGQWIDNTTISNFDINISVDIRAGQVVFSPFFTQVVGHRTLFGHHNAFGVNLSVVSWDF